MTDNDTLSGSEFINYLEINKEPILDLKEIPAQIETMLNDWNIIELKNLALRLLKIITDKTDVNKEKNNSTTEIIHELNRLNASLKNQLEEKNKMKKRPPKEEG